MDGQKALGVDEAGTRPITRQPLAPRPSTTATARLSKGWALFAGLVGPAVGAFCIAVEPAPADPNAPEPLIGTLLGTALLIAWGAAATTAVGRRASALKWAAGIGVLSVAMTVTCPASGHHQGIGLWWAAQMAVSVGALLIAREGLVRLRRERA
jgi:peptidoglycan/LPS O-acetylase OafA/YrhL